MFYVSYHSQTEQRTQITKSNFIVIDSDCAIVCRKYFNARAWFGCGNGNSEKIYDFKQKAKGRSFGCNSNNAYECWIFFAIIIIVLMASHHQIETSWVSKCKHIVFSDSYSNGAPLCTSMWSMRKMPMAKINLNSLCDCVSTAF